MITEVTPEMQAHIDATVGILTDAGLTEMDALNLMLKANVQGQATVSVGNNREVTVVRGSTCYRVLVDQCIHPGVFATGPVPGTEHCFNCGRDVPRSEL